jgi:hypothetical protein
MPTFTDGTTIDYTPGDNLIVVGLDYDGDLVVAITTDEYGMKGYLYPLTPCCHASGKGSESPTGVVCRKCYATVDSKFGGPTYPDEIVAEVVAK